VAATEVHSAKEWASPQQMVDKQIEHSNCP
jgi:hypothetical protein